jgi:excisionase family DNA binding protein
MTTSDPSQKPYLSIPEYAKLMGVGKDYVRDLIKGKIKGKTLPGVIRMGKGYKIPRDAVPIGSEVTPAKETPSTPEDRETAEQRKKLAKLKLEIEVAEAERKKAELDGTLLKGNELAKREAEVAEMQAEAERKLSSADSREAQLSEREERLKEREKQPQVTGEAMRELEEKRQAFKEDVANFDRRAERTTASLDNRETALQSREQSASENELQFEAKLESFQLDASFVAETVSALLGDNGKERKRALEEFRAHKWRILKIEW